ncbi:hypothetical protein HGRIS_004937 [Hohenbuehelia grisea]|uniref:Uncharacterized protein n=1 Tax=Hohenbuehelia grisea TaxID=104357 RepID=A0ABR3JDF8_9AGAR
MPGIPTLKIDLSHSYGALFAGVVVSVCLFGVTITQSFYFFMNYRDPVLVKLLVASLL